MIESILQRKQALNDKPPAIEMVRNPMVMLPLHTRMIGQRLNRDLMLQNLVQLQSRSNVVPEQQLT